MIASPCVNICQIDPDSGLCIGCLRTLDEIARWGGMTDGERQAIMDRLPERKRAGSDRP
ncbi:DUF1289 domain-containing protein [Paracoccus shanxieyensis]|uniref:DUF1289 domain-containing protein n=1 Tax=Paracoccus shanxieyensis TaxID=2675752 RepID=A0A6L6IQD9_9RHOB|nr:DUF1289 domain-containing protein [Paracoccus shanxieyensis]MTH62696.1 DUF1289 domain-containing protein [Paracoccus shanxieyensis]MTH86220.1 DUF1289 domain-containing protein [Paracoccus shanxieyensis]